MVVRCTAKLLKLLGLSPRSLPAHDPSNEDWYANLIWLDRRKCLLVMHAGTFFPALAADVSKADLVPFGPTVVRLIEQELGAAGFPSSALGHLDPTHAVLDKTADRSVLGCLNDNATMCRYVVSQHGGLARTDVAELNRRLRQNIHAAPHYAWPLDLVAQRLRRW